MLKINDQVISSKIYLIRSQKIMLDKDLAELYGVENKRLKEAVKRNMDRFPEDFMFEMNEEELEEFRRHQANPNLRTQIASSSWGGSRYKPYCFTEQGVAMLSSVLNSERAIKVNIQIIRLFSKMREMILTHKDILLKLEKLEGKVSRHDEEMKLIFNALKQLLQPPKQERKQIGFKIKK